MFNWLRKLFGIERDVKVFVYAYNPSTTFYGAYCCNDDIIDVYCNNVWNNTFKRGPLKMFEETITHEYIHFLSKQYLGIKTYRKYMRKHRAWAEFLTYLMTNYDFFIKDKEKILKSY